MEVYYTGKGDVCPVCGGVKLNAPTLVKVHQSN